MFFLYKMFGSSRVLLRGETSWNNIKKIHSSLQNYRKSNYRPNTPRSNRRGQSNEPETHDLLKSLQQKAKAKELNALRARRQRYAKKEVDEETVSEENQKEKSGVDKKEAKAEDNIEGEKIDKTVSKNKNSSKGSEKPPTIADLYKKVSFSWLKEYVPKYFFSGKSENPSNKSQEQKKSNIPRDLKGPPKRDKKERAK